MHLAMNSDFQKNPKFQVLPRVTYNHFGEGLFWTYMLRIKSWRRHCGLKNPLRWTVRPPGGVLSEIEGQNVKI